MPKSLYRQGKKRKMIKFRIDELAAVDMPAQAGAQALLMKRAEVEKVYRVVLLTTEAQGHVHGVYLYGDGDLGGTTSEATSKGATSDHEHAWTMDAMGVLTIGASAGHTHTVDVQQLLGAMMVLGKGLAAPEPVLDNQQVDKETTMTEQEIKDLQAKLARANALALLNDAEKAYFNGLGESDQSTFLTKSSGERASELVRMLESNPIVYTSTDGTVFRKNDEPRFVAMAKRADETQKALEASEAARESDRIAKRAETEFKHLPGTVAVRSALVKAIEGIKDEATRKDAEAALKAGDAALAKSFVELGTSTPGEGAAGDAVAPETKLNALAQKYVTDHKVSEAIAFSKVLDTDEGRALYAEFSNSRQAN